MLNARLIVIPNRMKALLTDSMLDGIDVFFNIPNDVHWRRLPHPAADGLCLLLEHPTFPAAASLDEVPVERWDLMPD